MPPRPHASGALSAAGERGSGAGHHNSMQGASKAELLGRAVKRVAGEAKAERRSHAEQRGEGACVAQVGGAASPCRSRACPPAFQLLAHMLAQQLQ